VREREVLGGAMVERVEMGLGDAKKPGSGESNPKFDRTRMLRHTTAKEKPFSTSPSQELSIVSRTCPRQID
jgi:hypothetical protein